MSLKSFSLFQTKMEDIFHGTFYSEAAFDNAFTVDALTPENRPGFDLTQQQLNSLVKYREVDYPSTTNTMRYHELSAYPYEKIPEGQTSSDMLQNGTTAGLEVLDELCLSSNSLDDTRSSEAPQIDGCMRQGRGQPLKKMRRLRANDRERRRMRSLNRALESLKKCLPVPQSKRRVTKLEILRIACNYIRSLSDTLSEDSRSNESPTRGRKSRSRGIAGDPVVNGFSVAQRLEILSGNNTSRV